MIITPNPKDAVHKAWLLRLLTEILDNPKLSQALGFKGGTCAAMLGYLDRFSVDLDFYLRDVSQKKALRKELHNVFGNLGLQVKDESQKALQFFLKYEAPANQRRTLKVDINDWGCQADEYVPTKLYEIDRTALTQTIETMFANKLVAAVERFEKTGGVAGRDIYDIHHFFMQGYRYKPEIIKERRRAPVRTFFGDLIDFVKARVTTTILDQDLNSLLPLAKFNQIRKTLKVEVLVFLNDELKRIS